MDHRRRRTIGATLPLPDIVTLDTHNPSYTRVHPLRKPVPCENADQS